MTVMAGVSLVGLSGSMIKDTLKENALGIFQSLAGIRTADLPTPEPIEQPEATKVLVGVFFILFAQILCVRFVSFHWAGRTLLLFETRLGSEVRVCEVW